jgi:glycosyltransferase involved in cell wall biosynthesis
MRIVVNLLPTLKPKTGVGHYAARLFAALGRQLSGDDLHRFPSGALEACVRRFHRTRPRGSVAAGLRPRGLTLGAANLLNGFVKRAARAAGRGCLGLAFRAACRRGGFDVYHEPNFIPLPCDVPAVVTVHDLSVVLHPDWHPADRVRVHEDQFRQGLIRARHVITVSEFVRREVISHLGIAPACVTAVHNGVGDEYFDVPPEEVLSTRTELGLPRRYLLFVGTIEPRKNVLTLLQAYCSLPQAAREHCPLVLAGGWGWKSDRVAQFFHDVAVGRNVIHLGYTDDRHLPGLYAGARALVYPSHYEGFGLPPIEMLACGGAVLASTADAHREVLGVHAHFVPPDDTDGWRAALSRATRDDDWLKMLRQGGRDRARRFGWDRCATETVAAYRAAAGLKASVAA